MATPGLGPHDLAARADFETFGNRFTRFAAGDGFRHKARKITGIARMTTGLPGPGDACLRTNPVAPTVATS